MSVSKEKLRKEGRGYKIWKTVEQIILENYNQLAGERMRDGFYLLREWLESLRNEGKINNTEFDYFAENYEYYSQDKWPEWEEKHNIRRPKTKPPTTVIDRGKKFTEAHLPDVWDRARGFIFVEKSGMASDLELLSYHGWTIIAAQGESTRTFREFVAGDDTERPILVVKDADYYGDGIVETLEGHSERTEHLALWKELEGRITEIGLTGEDAEALNLPRERDPTKSPEKWRVELNAFVVLSERHGIVNPLLCYVIAKLKELDIPICPSPFADPERRVKEAIRGHLGSLLEDFLDEVVDEATEDVNDFEAGLPRDSEGRGDYVELLKSVGENENGIDLEPLREPLIEASRKEFESLFWRRRSEYEDRKVIQKAGRKDVEKITKMIKNKKTPS